MTKNELLKQQMDEKKWDLTYTAYILGYREGSVRKWVNGKPMRKSVLILLSKVFKCEEFVK